jgi:hypothetical protein
MHEYRMFGETAQRWGLGRPRASAGKPQNYRPTYTLPVRHAYASSPYVHSTVWRAIINRIMRRRSGGGWGGPARRRGPGWRMAARLGGARTHTHIYIYIYIYIIHIHIYIYTYIYIYIARSRPKRASSQEH